MSVPPPLAFISYRRADSSASARWLAQTLARSFGARSVFIDTDAIRMADDWATRIADALAAATLLIPVIGPGWLRIDDAAGRRRLDRPGDWVHDEIRHCIDANKRILPLLLSKTAPHARDDLPPAIADLARFQAFELRDDRWEADLSLLLARMVELGFRRVLPEPIRYPCPQQVAVHELSESQVAQALVDLPGWTVVTSDFSPINLRQRTEFHRAYEFASFADAMAFMAAAVPIIGQMKHHPRWLNLWRTVSVWLSTWDIGDRPSQLDVELAHHLDTLRGAYAPAKERRS